MIKMLGRMPMHTASAAVARAQVTSGGQPVVTKPAKRKRVNPKSPAPAAVVGPQYETVQEVCPMPCCLATYISKQDDRTLVRSAASSATLPGTICAEHCEGADVGLCANEFATDLTSQVPRVTTLRQKISGCFFGCGSAFWGRIYACN